MKQLLAIPLASAALVAQIRADDFEKGFAVPSSAAKLGILRHWMENIIAS